MERSRSLLWLCVGVEVHRKRDQRVSNCTGGSPRGEWKLLTEPSEKATDPSVVHVRSETLMVAVEPVDTCTLERGGGRRQAPVAQPEQK